MYSEEELRTSIEKCYNYFIKLRKPFTYEIEGNGIRFKIGSKEIYKDLKELPIAQMYLICLNVMFDRSDKVNFKKKGMACAVYPKQN